MSCKRQRSLAFPLCRFSFADGRRCAQPASPNSNGLCYTDAHAAPRKLRRSDLVRELASPDGAPPTLAQVRRFQAKLPCALAEGLISRRELGTYRYLYRVLVEFSRSASENTAPCQPPPPSR